MNKKKMEKEIKIFSGKGDIKNSLISAGSNIIPEESIINNKYDNLNQKQNPMEYNIKVNKKRVKKETSLKQVSSSKLIHFILKMLIFLRKKILLQFMEIYQEITIHLWPNVPLF